jgi:hypothetical protein
MDLTLTLSAAEVAMLEARRKDADADLGAVVHAILAPIVAKDSEARLGTLADQYRALTPDLQVEAVEVLREWYSAKQLPSKL